MKKTKPTLAFLSVLCFFNLSKAQQFESGYDIQNQLQGQYVLDDQNLFNSTASELELNLEEENFTLNESTEVYETTLEVNFERSTFDDAVTHIYNDGWVVDNPLADGIDATDFIIVQSGNVEITSDITLSLITVEAGASITIGSGATVTSNIILNSAPGEFSSLISDGTIVGTVTYNRSTAIMMINELVSAPLSGQQFSAFAGANLNLAASSDLRAYAPFITSTDAYDNLDIVGDGSHILAAGNGYRAATTDGGNLIYIGDVETSDILDIAISASGDAWNLIGNPYPSYLDFESFLNANSTQLEAGSTAIYRYTGNSTDPWDIWNQATADNEDVIELVAPGQAFFVKAKSGGGLIDFLTSMRSDGTPSGDDSRDATPSHYGHLKLKLSSTSSNYATDFYFNSNASAGLDPGYDATIFGTSAPAFSIYSSLIEGDENIALAIQALNNMSMDNVVVPLGVNASLGQELIFSIVESDMSDSTNMYLEDIVNNTVTLLNTTDYILTPSTDLSGTGRFYLRFENTTLSTINVDAESVKIYVDNTAKTININGQLQSNTTAKLFDVNGRLVLTNVLNTNNTNQSINVSQLSSGVYIVELDNNTNERRIEKLIIR
ncbi:T9SS type A sorting domain-containing protein [Winogradskyella thalassocola]|uniref:Por secretion system C-terminal sorting domain-containing protein n=1 Tax=Winogradskyella thalassocola TaxID=262004 RepID=A0A1G8DPI6_9FLAO|nr:T9SS type A sorting domain-containing protein [Winogradskyella thalassocola]SDH59558.1 Por secretion system C-terminal sorting domain-containing protein [Winogradskyella thalassocola]